MPNQDRGYHDNAKGFLGRNIARNAPHSSARVDSAKRASFSHSKNERQRPVQNFTRNHNDGVQKNKAINQRICKAQSHREIFSIWKVSHADFNEVNLSTALHRLAKSKEKLKLTQLHEDEKSLFKEIGKKT